MLSSIFWNNNQLIEIDKFVIQLIQNNNLNTNYNTDSNTNNDTNIGESSNNLNLILQFLMDPTEVINF